MIYIAEYMCIQLFNICHLKYLRAPTISSVSLVPLRTGSTSIWLVVGRPGMTVSDAALADDHEATLRTCQDNNGLLECVFS